MKKKSKAVKKVHPAVREARHWLYVCNIESPYRTSIAWDKAMVETVLKRIIEAK